MLKIIIVCKKCNMELKVVDSITNCSGDFVIKVETCNNLDCRDCSECEVNQKLQKAKDALK